MIGRTISHYRICGKLGQGGMGEVFLAEDLALGRKVALKFLHADARGDARARERFVREARAAAALDDPFICKVYEAGEADDCDYIAMEFVDGRTLKNRIAEGPLPLEELRKTAIEVAEALKVAHDHGIVHRDLKPANIMLGPTGHAKVMDFGLAKRLTPGIDGAETQETTGALTLSGTVVGTLDYMSPEQLKGENADVRSDIFALGVTLYESLTGCHPFRGDSAAETIAAILSGVRRPLKGQSPAGSRWFGAILEKTLAKDPAERYQTADALLVDLKQATVGGQPETETTWARTPAASAAGRRGTARLRRNRRSWVGASLAGGISIAAIVTGVFWYQGRQPVLSFTARDWVLVSDFENRTGDAMFDRSLNAALAVSLSQSRYANVYPVSRIGPVLKRMGKAADTAVTERVGQEICQRESIRGLVCPAITKVGNAFVVSARLVDPGTGATVRSSSRTAEGYNRVLPALDWVAAAVRTALGESLQEIAKASQPLDRVTTPSIPALKAYSDGRILWRKAQYKPALELVKQAVTLDPDFAMAHAALGTYNCTTVFNNKTDGKKYFENALALAGRTTDRERQIIRLEYENFFGRPDTARTLFEVFLRAYPDSTTQRYNYALFLDGHDETEKAIREYMEVLRVEPEHVSSRVNLAVSYSRQGRIRESLASFQLAFELDPARLANDALNGTYGFTLAASGDQAKAREVFAKCGVKSQSLRSLALLDLIGGKYRDGREKLQQALVLNVSDKQALSEARNHLYLAAVLAAQGDRAASLREIDIAVARLDTVPPVTWLRSKIATAYARLGAVDRAARALEKLQKEVNPNRPEDNSDLHLLSGEIELARKNTAKAIEVLQVADGERRSLLTMEALARAREASGGLDEAIGLYEGVLSRTDRFGHEGQQPWFEAHVRAARLYVKRGDVQKARRVLQDLFSLWREADKDLPLLREARALDEKLKG